MEEQITTLFRYCWYNLFRDVQFVQKPFDTLIIYIYIYIYIYILEQILNFEQILISKNST